jgi:hypothetical protein
MNEKIKAGYHVLTTTELFYPSNVWEEVKHLIKGFLPFFLKAC